MPQTPYSVQPPIGSTHISAAGTVFVNTGAVLSVNINSMNTAAVGGLSLYNTTGTITGTTEVAALSFPVTTVFPAKLDIGPAGIGLSINTGTLAIVSTGTMDLTIGHRP